MKRVVNKAPPPKEARITSQAVGDEDAGACPNCGAPRVWMPGFRYARHASPEDALRCLKDE